MVSRISWNRFRIVRDVMSATSLSSTCVTRDPAFCPAKYTHAAATPSGFRPFARLPSVNERVSMDSRRRSTHYCGISRLTTCRTSGCRRSPTPRSWPLTSRPHQIAGNHASKFNPFRTRVRRMVGVSPPPGTLCIPQHYIVR